MSLDTFYGWLDATLRGQIWDREVADQAKPGTIRPFAPLTREDVAGLLQKTVRTLENWYRGDLMPRPVEVGGTYYWHPEVLQDWLDARLKGRSWRPLATDSADPISTGSGPIAAPVAIDDTRSAKNSSARPKRGATGVETPARLRGRARAAARLAEMNSP
jgi:hypothetical protein